MVRTRSAATAEAAEAVAYPRLKSGQDGSKSIPKQPGQQPPIAWLPTSWTLALLAAALAATSAVAVGVPEPYMVRACVVKPGR